MNGVATYPGYCRVVAYVNARAFLGLPPLKKGRRVAGARRGKWRRMGSGRDKTYIVLSMLLVGGSTTNQRDQTLRRVFSRLQDRWKGVPYGSRAGRKNIFAALPLAQLNVGRAALDIRNRNGHGHLHKGAKLITSSTRHLNTYISIFERCWRGNKLLQNSDSDPRTP